MKILREEWPLFIILAAMLLLATAAFLNSNRMLPDKVKSAIADKEDSVIPFTIVTEKGECWVVNNRTNGVVKEALFHADDLDKCIQFLREGEQND